MDQILKHGKVIHGWLGVSVQDVTPSIAKAFGLIEARGALVADVTPNSPASKSGIEEGDIILEVVGERIVDMSDMALKVGQTAPGTSLSIKLYRDGREQDVSVTLEQLEEGQQRAGSGDERQGGLEGLVVEDLTQQIARQLDLPPRTRGVVVVSVQPGSGAGVAGLRRGDVILEANRRIVTNVSEFERAVREAGDNPILLLVNRAGSTIFVAIEP
jgi:serine protease Do